MGTVMTMWATRVRTRPLVLLLMGLCSSGWAQSSRPGMGAIPYESGTMFRVWAPHASQVGVKGTFSGWGTVDLVSEGNGNWSADIGGASPGAEYKVVMTHDGWTFERADARARRVTHSNGNSIIYDHAEYDWLGDDYSTPWLNDTVIYEMHIGSFNPRPNGWTPGRFADAIDRLDHLQQLGVSVLQLMPVNEFHGDHSWGYNPSDLFAVETAFGGADGLKDFVREAHHRGMAVFLDVVHNHYGPSDLSLWQYDGWHQGEAGGIYFYNDDRRYTDWGATRPDYGRNEVRDFIKDQVRMWLDDYHIDGFRWDAVYSMTHTGGGPNPQGESLVWELNHMIHSDYPGTTSIAEDDAVGRGFDSEWDVGWHDGIKGQLTQINDAGRSMAYLASLVNNGANHGRVLYTESHDTVAEENGKQRLIRAIDGSNPTSIWARKRSLLGTAMVMTSVGVPMLFQGQELLEDQAFKAQVALRWDRATTHAGIFNAYRDLISLRRNVAGDTQGLRGTGSHVHHIDETNKVLAFHRWDAGGVGDDVVVVMNHAAITWDRGDYDIEFPYPGTWYTVYNSDATTYGADFGGVGPDTIQAAGTPPVAAVDMGMYSTLIFARSRNRMHPPEIRITSPADATTVSFGDAMTDVAGTASGTITTDVQVVNLSNGHEAAAPAGETWSLSQLPLVVGANRLIAYADASPGTTNAADRADDPVYGSTWEAGQNGGSGFRLGWDLARGTNAGHFLAESTGVSNLDIGARAWGLWANNGDAADAFRELGRVLGVGATVRVKFDNNWVDPGSSVGMGLENAAGDPLFEFFFIGGESHYRVRNAEGSVVTGLPWTDQGRQIQFSLMAPDQYVLHIDGSLVHTGVLVAAADRQIARFHAWNFSAGGGEAFNVYITDLEVHGPQWDAADAVTVFRLPASGFVDQDGDGLPDVWEQPIIDDQAGDDIDSIEAVLAADDYDGDRRTNLEEYIAGTNATDPLDFLHIRVRFGTDSPVVEFDSRAGRTYRIWYADDVATTGDWHYAHGGSGPIPGNGDTMIWTNSTPGGPGTRVFRLEAFVD